MILNKLHKFWIQNKTDIIDWIVIAICVGLILYTVVRLQSAHDVINANKTQILQLQQELEQQRHTTVMCQSLRADPKIQRIMEAR